jgi:hypothetical protein
MMVVLIYLLIAAAADVVAAGSIGVALTNLVVGCFETTGSIRSH